MYQPPAGSDGANAYHSKKGIASGDAIDVDRLFAAARRQARAFLACCVAGLALGIAYIATAVPSYTATANLLIDNSKVRAVEESYGSALNTDTAYVDSQVEILRSEKVALSAIEKLNLIDNPSFAASRNILATSVKAVLTALNPVTWFRTPDPGDQLFAKRRAAVAQIRSNLLVSRVGRTYVLRVDYKSSIPEEASRIANGIAEAYLNDQLDSKYEATRRASSWLQERVDQLRQRSIESDLAMQKFKTAHNLISARGQLVNEQQLAEANTQVTLAQGNVAQTEARYSRIRAIIDNKLMDAAISEALNHPIVLNLREKYLNASKREAELTAKLGSNHVQPINLRNEMREYERLIFEELGRMAEGIRSELEIARSRLTTLLENLQGLTSVNAEDNETLVELRDLEREAESYRNLYQTFLQRYQESVQQQSFPMTEARVITEATRPASPSEPKKALVVALSLMLGGIAGAGLGVLREYRDRVFRTGAQVRDELGLEFIGMLPLIEAAELAKPGVAEKSPAQKDRKKDSKARPEMNYALDHPLSGFTETLRSAKVASDLTLDGKTPKIIGVISVLPGEGKSTVSKNFASLLAHLGSSTLLIDGDIRNPGLSRAVAPSAKEGLLDAVLDGCRLSDLCVIEKESRLAILPTVLRGNVSHTSDILASPGMLTILKQAGKQFDHIVIDLPPLGPVVDVRAVAQRIDAFIFVVEWGATARKVVRNALAANDTIYQKTLGVVLNKVRRDQIQMYEDYTSTDYYHSSYAAYYRSGD